MVYLELCESELFTFETIPLLYELVFLPSAVHRSA